MASDIPRALVDAVAAGSLVVVAGAGVSAVAPSRLPGWFALNAMIAAALGKRVDAILGRTEPSAEIVPLVDARRREDGFPPDYQAQILEEGGGAAYFEALTSLDVDVPNLVHGNVAELARVGGIRAIVTTNFDRLLERALDVAGVRHEVAFEPGSFARCLADLESAAPTPLWVIKIHGCVCDPASLIDTLKQRMLGRDRDLLRLLQLLLERNHALYAGFSADDLMSDDGYLGLIPAAQASPGLTYLSWAGNPALRPGAQKLVDAYGAKAAVAAVELPDFFAALVTRAGGVSVALARAPAEEPTSVVARSLDAWASRLPAAAAVTCLAAVAEAVGQPRAAFWLLHRFWKDASSDDRATPAFARFRAHHGRVGVASGLLSLAREQTTERVEEGIQNLLRIADEDPRGAAWAGLAFIWSGQVDHARSLLARAGDQLRGDLPAEMKVDVWLAIAEALWMLGEVDGVIATSVSALELAAQAGDVARHARVASLVILHEAEVGRHDECANRLSPIFERAGRLNDPHSTAFARLAAARALSRERSAHAAIEELNQAGAAFAAAARSPWRLYVVIEQAKALVDLAVVSPLRIEDARRALASVGEAIADHPVWSVWEYEAWGQLHLATGNRELARAAFMSAIEAAEAFGLMTRAGMLRQYLPHVDA